MKKPSVLLASFEQVHFILEEGHKISFTSLHTLSTVGMIHFFVIDLYLIS